MTELSTCLTWIRILRALRRQGDFGALERQALDWNFAAARALADRLRKKKGR